MRIRVPTRIELLIQGVLGFVLILLLVDFLQALDATACSAPGRTRNCYPWGMTEGPMEGWGWGWSYSNKDNYLISQGIGMSILMLAALAPIFARSSRSGLVALVVIPVLGRVGFWLMTS